MTATAPIAFALPNKPTCTPVEAAAATGISERQIRNMIEDGTLLAISANRDPENTLRPQWRIIVRMQRQKLAGVKGLTLEEEVERRKSV